MTGTATAAGSRHGSCGRRDDRARRGDFPSERMDQEGIGWLGTLYLVFSRDDHLSIHKGTITAGFRALRDACPRPVITGLGERRGSQKGTRIRPSSALARGGASTSAASIAAG